MGIDVSLYKQVDTTGDYICIEEVHLREHVSYNNYYATEVLFKEAFDDEMIRPLKPKPETLQARLPATLDAIAKRCRNLPLGGEDIRKYEQGQKELFTKFVEVYTEEYNKGNDPIIYVW